MSRKASCLVAAIAAVTAMLSAAAAAGAQQRSIAGIPAARPLKLSLAGSTATVTGGVLKLHGLIATAGWSESTAVLSGDVPASAVLRNWRALGFAATPPSARLVGVRNGVPSRWNVTLRLRSHTHTSASFAVTFRGTPVRGTLARAGLIITAPAPGDTLSSPSPNQLCTVGTVSLLPLLGGTQVPAGYYAANGGTMPIANDVLLWEVIGNYYGGDGTSTFGLPNVPPPPGMVWGICAGSSQSPLPSPGGSSACRTDEIVFFPTPMASVIPTAPNWSPANGSSIPVAQGSQFAQLADINGTTFTTPAIPNPGPHVRAYLCTAGSSEYYWPVISQTWYLGSEHLFAYGGPPNPTAFPLSLPLGPTGRSASQLSPANGATLQINDNPALYSVISNQYGGSQADGTFALPNLNARVPAGAVWTTVVNGIYPARR